MSWHSQQDEPLTWQYTAASILKFDVRILHAIGVWALPVTRVYRAYTGIILVLVVAYSVEAVIHIRLVRFNLDDITLAVSTYAVIVTSAGKLLSFLHHEPGYWRLVRWLDALVADQKKFCEERPPLQAIFDRAQKRATRFTHALRIYNTSLILAWVFIPLMAPPGQRPLPFQQLPLSETDDFPLYIASYLLQSVCMLYMSLVSGSLDGFFTAVMIHTAAQFRILAWRIAELRQNNEGRKQQARSDVYEKSQKAAETDDVYEELRLCIRTHQEITSFAAHLESVMKSIAALQLVTGVTNGCLMIFPTAASSESGAALLKCVACAPTISAQVLIYCLGAHSVQEQLLNAGYSYYALLKNFNSR
ncbi:uncharacterized protein LOC126482273 [Schistocerca serialis cubense]|uniref:uncharacterized protein LOC126482273 n=1 Tax=Schistocerca serialis cubense TaxID=2023355 RepID=UPI00214F4827|nr:uncharacterized protein LOC126482273 [Schistocerca serialis cubense]